MSFARKALGAFAAVAVVGTGLVGYDYYDTKGDVKEELTATFKSVSTGEKLHPFYQCISDRSAPAIARERMAGKYQEWKDEYAPDLPFDFVEKKDPLSSILDIDLTALNEISRHVDSCADKHGTPEKDLLDAIIKQIKSKSGGKLQFELKF